MTDTVNPELREVREHWYRPEDKGVRGVIAGWVVQLRRVDSHARTGAWDEAKDARQAYREAVARSLPEVLAAEPRSFYDSDVLADYLGELERLVQVVAYQIDK